MPCSLNQRKSAIVGVTHLWKNAIVGVTHLWKNAIVGVTHLWKNAVDNSFSLQFDIKLVRVCASAEHVSLSVAGWLHGQQFRGPLRERYHRRGRRNARNFLQYPKIYKSLLVILGYFRKFLALRPRYVIIGVRLSYHYAHAHVIHSFALLLT